MSAQRLRQLASAWPADPLRPTLQLKTFLASLADHPRLTTRAVQAVRALEENQFQTRVRAPSPSYALARPLLHAHTPASTARFSSPCLRRRSGPRQCRVTTNASPRATRRASRASGDRAGRSFSGFGRTLAQASSSASTSGMQSASVLTVCLPVPRHINICILHLISGGGVVTVSSKARRIERFDLGFASRVPAFGLCGRRFGSRVEMPHRDVDVDFDGPGCAVMEMEMDTNATPSASAGAHCEAKQKQISDMHAHMPSRYRVTASVLGLQTTTYLPAARLHLNPHPHSIPSHRRIPHAISTSAHHRHPPYRGPKIPQGLPSHNLVAGQVRLNALHYPNQSKFQIPNHTLHLPSAAALAHFIPSSSLRGRPRPLEKCEFEAVHRHRWVSVTHYGMPGPVIRGALDSTPATDIDSLRPQGPQIDTAPRDNSELERRQRKDVESKCEFGPGSEIWKDWQAEVQCLRICNCALCFCGSCTHTKLRVRMARAPFPAYHQTWARRIAADAASYYTCIRTRTVIDSYSSARAEDTSYTADTHTCWSCIIADTGCPPTRLPTGATVPIQHQHQHPLKHQLLRLLLQNLMPALARLQAQS
ncbi:hypothetical protein EVG20_g8171 [Dentipellis fragilis]|uniref:Uncharacterized protein n=1 Tax=Dentipellis fragilis TaxID=205917 RepID=A0A4Y9Y799_9AGAM|nr:hypothetical protein EVG20_g8171 [Dentipellis fragilis]